MRLSKKMSQTILLVMALAIIGFMSLMTFFLNRYQKEQVDELIALRNTQTHAFFELYHGTIHDTLLTNAQWTGAQRAVLEKNEEFIEEEAAGYLIDDGFRYVDFVVIVGDNGFTYAKGTPADAGLYQLVESISLEERDPFHRLILWEEEPVLLHTTSITDNQGDHPVGRYALGTRLSGPLIEELRSIVPFTHWTLNGQGESLRDGISFDFPFYGDNHLTFHYPEPRTHGVLRQIRTLLFFLMSLLALLVLWIIRYLIMKESRGILRLIAAVDRIAAGHYEEELDPLPYEETQRLATSIETMAHRIQQYMAEAEKHTLDSLLFLSKTQEVSDAYTKGHAERVATLAKSLGEAVGYDAPERLYRAGLLHDIGKIGIPSEILHKPGKLTKEEYDLIKTHTALGAELLDTAGVFEDLIPLVKYHHERPDGKGYHGLTAKEIPLGAKILAYCDIYDALTSDRPYRQAMSHIEAMELMEGLLAQGLDPMLFVHFQGLFPLSKERTMASA